MLHGLCHLSPIGLSEYALLMVFAVSKILQGKSNLSYFFY